MKNRPWRLAYNAVGVPLMMAGAQVARRFSPKLDRALAGRQNLFLRLESALEPLPTDAPRLWLHAASVGEFEQGRPILRALKEQLPELQTVVSFQSPSGYDLAARRQPPEADVITYLPLDTRRAAERFVATVRPTLGVVVRYEYWPNHTWAMSRVGRPLALVCASLRADAPYLAAGLRPFARSVLSAYSQVLTVSQTDLERFRDLLGDATGEPKLLVAGDTRYDQVLRRRDEARSAPPLLPEAFTDRMCVVVAGSTWPPDESALTTAFDGLRLRHPNLRLVLVPHEPTAAHLEPLMAALGSRFGPEAAIRYSHLDRYRNQPIIVVDRLGILVALYGGADIAYVGGGFTSGIHSTLEAAAYGIPVIFGPKHGKSPEAAPLIESGGGIAATDAAAVATALGRFLDDKTAREAAGSAAGALIESGRGATERTVAALLPLLTGGL